MGKITPKPNKFQMPHGKRDLMAQKEKSLYREKKYHKQHWKTNNKKKIRTLMAELIFLKFKEFFKK